MKRRSTVALFGDFPVSAGRVERDKCFLLRELLPTSSGGCLDTAILEKQKRRSNVVKTK